MDNANTKTATGKTIAAQVAALETEGRFNEGATLAMDWVHAGPPAKHGIDYSVNRRHASLTRAGLVCCGGWMTVGRLATLRAAG